MWRSEVAKQNKQKQNKQAPRCCLLGMGQPVFQQNKNCVKFDKPKEHFLSIKETDVHTETPWDIRNLGLYSSGVQVWAIDYSGIQESDSKLNIINISNDTSSSPWRSTYCQGSQKLGGEEEWPSVTSITL